MKKTNLFVLFFAMFFPIVVFGALQATSEIISTSNGLTNIKTTVSGLEAGQKADVLIGVSLKGVNETPSKVAQISVDKNGSLTTTVNNELPSSVFQPVTKVRLSQSQTITSANDLTNSKIKIIGVGQTANSISVKADFSNLKNYVVWKVGVACDQEAVDYDPTNSPLDKGREFYFEKVNDQIYLYELTADGKRNQLRISSQQEDKDFFETRVMQLSFAKAKPGSKYGCYTYAVKGETIGSSISRSDRVYFNTTPLEAYIEDFCVIDGTTIDVLVSYFGYDFKLGQPTVYLKYKKNVSGSDWVKAGENSLPSTPETTTGKRCVVKNENQARFRLTGLQTAIEYYVAPAGYLAGVDYSTIEWETVKVGTSASHYLADGKTIYGLLQNYKSNVAGVLIENGKVYPRKINTKGINITTENPTLANVGKSTFAKCAEYTILNASVFDRRQTNTNYIYWFKIIDNNGNIYCTQYKTASARTSKVSLDVSSCNPLYTVFECSAIDGSPVQSKTKRFRMFPNRQYTIIAMAKGAGDISTSVGTEKTYQWGQDPIRENVVDGYMEIGVDNTVTTATRLVGKYPLNQNIYKGAFKVTDTNTGESFITDPKDSKTDIKVYGNKSFFYDLKVGNIEVLDAKGENTINFIVKPNTSYSVRSIAYNLASSAMSGTFNVKTRGINYPGNIQANTVLFWQCSYSCSAYPDPEGFCHSGCGESAMAVVMNYYYKIDPNVKAKWNDVVGMAPTDPCIVTQYEADSGALVGLSWSAEGMRSSLAKIGLTYRLVYDNVDALHQKYTSKGVPVILRCLSDSGLTTSQHFIVMTGISGNYITMRSSNSSHGAYTEKWRAQACIDTNSGDINKNAIVIAPPEFFANN